MKKKGSSVIATPIMIAIAIISITMIFVFVINMIMPYVIYLKIENIAAKYIYVIEKFGFLTESEKNNMLSELSKQGINSNYITLEYPSKKEPYGTLVSLNISYDYEYNIPSFSKSENKRKTTILVKKNSFSKVY